MRIKIFASYFKSIKKIRLVLMIMILLASLFVSQNITAAVKGSKIPVMLGLYASDYLGLQSVIDSKDAVANPAFGYVSPVDLAKKI